MEGAGSVIGHFIQNHANFLIGGSWAGLAALFGVIDGVTPTAVGASGVLGVVVTMVVLVFRSQQIEIKDLRARVRELEAQDEQDNAEMRAEIRRLAAELAAKR